MLALWAMCVAFAPTSAQPAADNTAITVTLPAELDPAVRGEVLEALDAAGARLVVPTPDSAPAGWQQHYADALDAALVRNGQVGPLLAAYWARLGGVGGMAGVFAALGLGIAAWWLVASRRQRPPQPAGALPGFRARLRGAGGNVVVDALAIGAFLTVSFVTGYLLLPEAPPVARLTLAGFAGELTMVLVLIAITRLITDPRSATTRLAPLNDAAARHVWRAALVAIILPTPFLLYRAVVTALADGSGADTLTTVAAEALLTTVRIWLFWRVREPVAGLIAHGFGRRRGADRDRIATYWVAVYTAFAVVHLVTVVASELEGADIEDAADRSFMLLILLPFIVGGIGAWFDDATAARQKARGDVSYGATALVQGAVLVVGGVAVLRAWGIDPLAGAAGGDLDRLAGALLQATGAIVVGWAVWRGVEALLDRYAPRSGEAGVDDDGMGKTGSRIDTLLPVLRSAAFVAVVVISGLTALSALGINITALLAGAGVIGLAVGFGAQTLVKDVITGVFYLVEDAFRVGEYIVTDEGKGVVERISLRSVRLRHHRGPVYTIPFGAMGTVQNHSRDWVKIKMLVRVPFDTDIEQVRKLIKRVGVELMEEPSLSAHILAPVKSQGVLDVDDSAIVIGVKFICKPGEQFVIRREAYARIKQSFATQGIAFAPKRVIVEGSGEERQRNRAGAATAIGDDGIDPAS